ncbi:MAG: sensor histidine kinase [Candidatus Weimeria sp.]
MTIKKRLFLSNIMMIVIPVIATMLIGVLCVAFIWFGLIHGMGMGIKDQDEFEVAGAAISEGVKEAIEDGKGYSSVEAILKRNNLTLLVETDKGSEYKYGDSNPADAKLIRAARVMGNEGSIAKDGRMLFSRSMALDGATYRMYLTGDYAKHGSFSELKAAVALSGIVILFTIFLSILLTNRFLTKFVWEKIEEPLDILVNGVHELGEGNLDFRIEYDRDDEFGPVCRDFNEMAGHLKEMVIRIENQEKSRKELIAGISHDIRSPLTSIQGYVEGLLDGIANTPEKQRSYLETIREKALDLEHIVSELFMYSKMEIGEKPKLQMIRIDDVVGETAGHMKADCSRQGLDITTDMEEVTLEADPFYLQRITANIIENSLKYKNREHGSLKISLHRQGPRVILSFADDGPGVDDDALPHLFEIFYRSDKARQNPHQGSGLGLAIVSSAVRQMGGYAQAFHSEAGGLEIRITFEEKEKSDE